MSGSNQAPKRALVSVFDKTGLEGIAKALVAAGHELVSSGGTAAFLTDCGLPVTDVAEGTGFPEMLDGRVKTLHPNIHGGLLAALEDPEHVTALEAHDITPISVVVCNLYPFAETVADPDSSRSDIIEKIDIGGPSMVRAGAKNHAHVAVVTSPQQYDEVIAALEGPGIDAEMRRRLAQGAFEHTAAYDAAVATWFAGDEAIPPLLPLTFTHYGTLRYGENPHQAAGLYSDGSSSWWSNATQHQGKEMSFNNYADAESAHRLAADLPTPGAVVVKHTNPAGAATASTLHEAFTRAWAGDPLAAFGGVIAVNAKVDTDTASRMIANFAEIVIAPAFSDAALEVFFEKPNLRVLSAGPVEGRRTIRFIDGGALVQEKDRISLGDWDRQAGGDASMEDLELAWIVAAHTKSNAVVLVKDGATVGVGAGDQSRVGAVKRALAVAGDRADGAVAASDAFFTLRDGVDALASAGVVGVVEPGGSVRDDEVVAAAREHGMALYFTGRRHFLH